MHDAERQELLEQLKSEIRAIGNDMGEGMSRQQLQNALNRAEDNISRLLSNYQGISAVPPDSELTKMGGRMGKGRVDKSELGGDVEIRVSMRSSRYLGSVELFTLRNVEPACYHLYLLAIPRDEGSA